MARPGIMLYFDLLGPIRALSDADKGRLLMAMLEYGKDGVEPKFDGMLAFAWEFVKPKLDKDGESYESVKLQRRYAAFCRHRAAANLPKISFDEWLRTVATDNEPQRAVTDACSRVLPLPTTTTSTTTSTTTTPTTTTSESQGAPEEDFESLWQIYPAERRGDRVKAFDAFRMDITSHDEAVEAMENLKCWKQSEQWRKSGGQFVPYLCNWLLRGTWRVRPTNVAIPQGASGVLGEAELEAIRRVLEQDMEE